MRRVLVTASTLAALLAGLLGPVPGTAALANPTAEPGPAAERLNRGRFEPGAVPTPAPFPTVELSANGVFHLHPGIIHSQRFGQVTRFPGAPVDWSPGTISASAASGTGDYVVAATSRTTATHVEIGIETVEVAATTAVDRASPAVPLTPGATTRRVWAAAAGDHIYLAVTQSGASNARSAHLLHSADRGESWQPRVDLLALADLDDTGTRPVVSLAAEGRLVAAVVGGVDEAGSLLVSDDHGSTFADPVDVSSVESSDPSGALRGPASVATDGASVRVAWLRAAPGSSPILLSAAVSSAGAPTAPVSVPTAPSTFSGGVGTEVVLAALGSTYAVQVEGGRLFALDPDGAWRWPLPFEPTDSDSACAPSCPTILPAAVYGGRLVHRGYGYFSYWFIDRTPSRMRVQQNPGPLLEDWQTVVLEFEDDGGIDLTRSRCAFDGRPAPLDWYPVSCSGPPAVGAGRHELVATIVDLAGNTATFRHRWTTTSKDGLAWRAAPPAWSPVGPATFRWRLDPINPVRRQVVTVATRGPDGRRRTSEVVSTSARARTVRIRPGVTTCVSVTATGHGFRTTGRRCVSGAIDDRALEGDVTRLRSRRYSGGSAALLRPGRPVVAPNPDDRTIIRTWGLRVLTCPRCGTLRISDTLGRRTVGLRSNRPRIRVVTVAWNRHSSSAPLTLRGAGGRVVIDGYWVDRSR